MKYVFVLPKYYYYYYLLYYCEEELQQIDLCHIVPHTFRKLSRYIIGENSPGAIWLNSKHHHLFTSKWLADPTSVIKTLMWLFITMLRHPAASALCTKISWRKKDNM